MSTEDWYRNTTWNSEIQEAFEARLKRSRGAFHKAQYLRIQAGHLLDHSDKSIQTAGVNLMERLIEEFPTETFCTIFAQEQLGDYYLKTHQFEKAEKYFRVVVDHYIKTNSRSGTTGMADLKVAKTILMADWANKYVEAYSICMNYPTNELGFNNNIFYYAELVARLCDRMNKVEEARLFANKAIELSKITEPQLSRHKTIGLVKTTDKQLRLLEQIANK